MKKKLFLIFIFITFNFPLFSQTSNWLWAKSIGGTSGDACNSIAIDFSGNVYTTGSFSGTVDFDPGLGVFNLTSAGAADIFISKLDNAGNFVWAKAMGGASSEVGYSLALDVSGNVYTTGLFRLTADFDPGTATFNLTSKGSSDIFISKLDSSGNFVWAKSMGGTEDDLCCSIAADASGNVYTTGSFFGTADFDPGAGTFNLTSVISNDIFISKLDNSGNFIWAKRIGAAGGDNGWSITLSPGGNGDVYTTGIFTGAVDFDPGAGGFILYSSFGSSDIFISKLDSFGNFVWAKRIGGTSWDVGFSIAIDPAGSGNLYTTGYFTGTADFDPGAGTFNLTSAGSADIFISKLDSSGNFLWAKDVGGTMYDRGLFIAVDPSGSGDVYTTGYFAGTADLDPGAGTFNLTSAGSDDFFISKLDSSGNFAWAKAIGGTTIDNGNSIALDAVGHVYVAGDFKSPSISFGTITLTNADNSGNSADIFIAKLDSSTLTGIEIVQNNINDISVFPNPATSSFTILLPGISKKVEVTITDITGKIIYSTSVTGTQKLEVITKDFAEGIFLVRIQTGENLKIEKLIVKK